MKEESYSFDWSDIGDINLGRPNLGEETKVSVYRMMQYSMRGVLAKEFGSERASKLIYDSGYIAGLNFCKTQLDTKLELNQFLAQLQKRVKEYKIGIVRVEKIELESLEMTLTVEEDLDCSGLNVTNERVCDYDEGFIAGILEFYTNLKFSVKEVDCWSSGGRVCRFKINVEE
ncbi:MAG: V4R domain-containing protein [Bacteroidales bacterium]